MLALIFDPGVNRTDLPVGLDEQVTQLKVFYEKD